VRLSLSLNSIFFAVSAVRVVSLGTGLRRIPEPRVTLVFPYGRTWGPTNVLSGWEQSQKDNEVKWFQMAPLAFFSKEAILTSVVVAWTRMVFYLDPFHTQSVLLCSAYIGIKKKSVD